MKYHHFTGIIEFYQIIKDEALLSNYEIMKKCFHSKLESKNAEKVYEQYIGIERKVHNEREFMRKSNVFLTMNKDVKTGHREDVILGFELDKQPNHGAYLILPEVSLEHLVEVNVIEACHIKTVRKILADAHGGKYKNIPVCEWKR
jgi:hypothetical protein